MKRGPSFPEEICIIKKNVIFKNKVYFPIDQDSKDIQKKSLQLPSFLNLEATSVTSFVGILLETV